MKWENIEIKKYIFEAQMGDYELRTTEKETTHTAKTAALTQLEIPQKSRVHSSEIKQESLNPF